MTKFKLFIENFLVYGLGGIISKIIPLIMVPIVTRLMPNSEYFGISDMSNTIVSFAMYFAILGMYDAMYRLFFDKEDEEYKKDVCSTTLFFNIISSGLMCFVLVIFRKQIAEFFLNNRNYSYIIYLTAIATFVGATNSIVSAPTRMQNKRKVFLITNTVSPLLSYSVSIPLLLNGYYLIALPLAGVISAAIIEIVFWRLNKEWFEFRRFDKDILKSLFKIGIPLLPNFLIYWVFNSCDRVMITKMINIGEAGIYSVGAKLGMTSQLIYTAFAGGWQFFAFSTMKEDNQVENNSKVFEYLGCISYACTLFICVIAKPLYRIVFSEEYHNAYIVSPYLFLAPLLLMLFQVACNQFIVVKKTWPNMIILSIGAVANIIINLYLIPRMGIEGAAIATLIGYIISVVVCVLVLVKMELMVVSRKFILTSALMAACFWGWRLFAIDSILISSCMAVTMITAICLIYISDIKRFICIFKGRK